MQSRSRSPLRHFLPILIACQTLAMSAGAQGPEDWVAGPNERPVEATIIDGRPPRGYHMPVVDREALRRSKATSVLWNTPALDWSYGCSPTSAAMLFGYYDRNGFPDMYTGPANSGVFPLPTDSTLWGETVYAPSGVTCMECPLSASHQGIDGRASRGHVDDYWIDAGNPGPDPYIVNGWAEHAYGNCTADYMLSLIHI